MLPCNIIILYYCVRYIHLLSRRCFRRPVSLPPPPSGTPEAAPHRPPPNAALAFSSMTGSSLPVSPVAAREPEGVMQPVKPPARGVWVGYGAASWVSDAMAARAVATMPSVSNAMLGHGIGGGSVAVTSPPPSSRPGARAV